MPRWFRRSTHLLAVLGLLSLPVPAAAQDIAAAEALFDRGLADMQAGRYETGCKALAESERLDPQPGTLFTLAACEAEWGRIATAVTRFGQYLALFERLTPAQQARQGERPKLARQRREKLAPRVPRLALSLAPGAPPGTEVRRNGIVLGEAALGVALPVDPGAHVVSIHAPGAPAREQHITIAEGETRELTLELKETPAPQTPAPPPASPTPAASRSAPEPAPKPVPAGTAPKPVPAGTAPKPAPAGTAPEPVPAGAAPKPVPAGRPDAPAAPTGSRTAVFVTGGIGAAGLVVGGITGALVFSKKGVVEEHCGRGIRAADPKACDTTGADAGNSANAMAGISTMAFGVALAGLGTAAVLYWTQPKPTGVVTGTSPRWVSAGVLEAGPGGAVLGARGSF